MSSDPDDQLQTLRTKIRERERDVSDADAKALLDFSDQLALLRSEYSDYRHLKLLRHCTRMAEEVGGLADAVDDRDAAEEIVRWIHRTYDNEETNRDYRVALRIFGKRTTDVDDVPDALDWISTKTSNDYNPVPDPADMLSWEDDVKPMIEETPNTRDKAMLAIAFDSGMRSGEFQDLTVGDISDGDHGLLVRVDGKTGERSIDLILSVPFVNQWLANHPAPDDADAPLWSKLREPDPISYERMLQAFRAAARRANVDKPVTPTNFRKSNATWLAKQGANEALIEDRQGRARGSEAISRYVARFGDDAGRQYAAMLGKEVEQEPGDETTPPVDCPRCARETPADRDRCMWCGQALTPEASQETTDRIMTVAETIDEVDDETTRDALMTLLEQLQMRPVHDDTSSS